MREVVIGALTMGYATAGLFFLRFWHETRDRLFAFFAVAFFVLAVNRLGFATTPASDRVGDYHYWIRLLAFGIILVAVLDKNLGSSGTRKTP